MQANSENVIMIIDISTCCGIIAKAHSISSLKQNIQEIKTSLHHLESQNHVLVLD